MCTPEARLRIDELVVPVVYEEVLDLDPSDDAIDNKAALALYYMSMALDVVDPNADRIARRIAGDLVWTAVVEDCDDGTTRARSEHGRFPIGMLADFADTGVFGWTPVAEETLDLSAGTITGALAPGYELVVARAFLPMVQARMDAGESWAGGALDFDGDGAVQLDELMASDTWTWLLSPDVDADDDGEAESLSYGFAISLTPSAR